MNRKVKKPSFTLFAAGAFAVAATLPLLADGTAALASPRMQKINPVAARRSLPWQSLFPTNMPGRRLIKTNSPAPKR